MAHTRFPLTVLRSSLTKCRHFWQAHPFTTASVVYQVLLAIAITALAFYHERRFTGAYSVLQSWDGISYFRMAQDGYVTEGDNANYIAYYPLYPMTMRLLGWLGLDLHLAGLLITVVSSLIGHSFLARYFIEAGWSVGRVWRLMLLLFFTPITVYFSVLYTEALFLAEIAVFLWCLQRQYYGWAVLAGMCATATRLFGIFFLVLYVGHFLEQQRWRTHWRSLFLGVLIPLGLISYLGINWSLFGDPFHFLIVQRENWFKASTNPLQMVWVHLQGFWQGRAYAHRTMLFDVIATLVTPLILLAYLLLMRWSRQTQLSLWLWLWSALQWLLIASQSFWLSNLRYLSLIVTLYAMIAELSWRASRWLYYAVLAGFAVLAGYALDLYVRGGWVY